MNINFIIEEKYLHFDLSSDLAFKPQVSMNKRKKPSVNDHLINLSRKK